MVFPDLETEPFHVLDFPQLYTKPSYESLITILETLQIRPPTWNPNPADDDDVSTVIEDRTAVASYLSRIISSSLQWLEDDEEREKVWEAASKRLSERSGRSGMSAMTRPWTIPATSTRPEISLSLHEPPLTGDNLGHKTWASSYLLALRLEFIGSKYLSSTLQASHTSRKAPSARVLELGSGTGLVGLAAAFIWQCEVTLTDLPEIVPNLELNADHNSSCCPERFAIIEVEILDWNKPPKIEDSEKYQIILAADPLYSHEHPEMLAKVINSHLSQDPDSRVVIELPMRDKATEDMLADLIVNMAKHGFTLVEDKMEMGFDDWEKNGERTRVTFWWGIWKWR